MKKSYLSDHQTVNNHPRSNTRKILLGLVFVGLLFSLLQIKDKVTFFSFCFLIFTLVFVEYCITTLGQPNPGLTALIGVLYTSSALFSLCLLWFYPSLIIPVILIVTIADVAAQVSGQLFKKITNISLPIFPAIKNKSWAGLIGAIFFSGLSYYVLIRLPFLTAFTYLPGWAGFLIGFGAQSGDLLNSFFKRLFGFKDWTILPNGFVLLWDHGGLIDRLCSYPIGFLAALAVMIFLGLEPSRLI